VLSAKQLELMTLCLYGDSPKEGKMYQYWWVDDSGSQPVWIRNVANNRAGVEYADDVYARAQQYN
jgi:hypothetical protein